MNTTLYISLKPKASDFSSLHKKYNPVLQLVNILIGTIPNAGSVMEIWPISFRTYNLFVPNLLNFPSFFLGNKSVKSLMGLAMYQSSLAAKCYYCTAHSCSFAIRRGLNESVVSGEANKKEAAVINFSRKMAQIPCEITKEDYETLKNYCTANEVEAISMGIVLMAFLNKFMDVMGITLEQDAIDDVADLLSDTGWKIGKHFDGEAKPSNKNGAIKKDSLLTYLKVARQAPGAILLEKKWTKGVPGNLKDVSSFLKDNIGHHFSILSKLKQKKQIRALATILRDNFSASNTHIGLRVKVLCGLIFAKVVKNTYLEKELLHLARNNNIEINEQLQSQLIHFSGSLNAANNAENKNAVFNTFSEKEITTMYFIAKASTIPSDVDEQTTRNVVNQLSPESIIEIVTWISILHALHRLEKLPVS